ncbi:MAG: hypothetical protein L6300_16530 [Syntrophaceae bacterium]|nr:hypothetical protein [Pseudomonadota bacterium]MCG2741825.1 hypothetical protein [Syntrophaceae bacterium]
MENKLPILFLDLANKFVGFIPKLIAGMALLVLGFLVAWFVKRLVIQVSIALRLERFLIKFRWGKAFSKADVRHGFYNFLGNLFYFFILLAFLDLAFIAWDLKFLSDLLGEAISLFPRAAAAMIILGIGWFVAVRAASGILRVLLRENVEQARVIGMYARIMLIVLFSAMALVKLDVAGNIVTIGFTTIFITLGIIAVVLVAKHGKASFKKQSGPEDDKNENGGG